MKIECVQEKLDGVMRKVKGFTGKNVTLPILGSVLLEAKGNTLTIKATNLDLGIEVRIPVKVDREGVVAVPAEVFAGYVTTSSPQKNIKLETEEQYLLVSSPVSKTKIKTHTADDFPLIPRIKTDHSVKIQTKDIVNGLRSVWYSAGVSSVKPELSSVMIALEGDVMVFAATDSFRLAEKRIKAPHIKEFPTVLIPFKNVGELLRLFEEISGDIEITATKNQISFVSDGVYATSRVIDGSFPDYKQIIPKDFTTTSVLLKEDLTHLLRIAGVFSDKFNQLHFTIDPSSKTFEVVVKNTEVGESANRVAATLQGEPVEINFNYKYIIDCLPSIPTDSLSLSFNGQSRPLVIHGIGDKTFTYLVMPMNR